MAELDNMNINELRAERNRHIIAKWTEMKPEVEAGRRTRGVILAIIAAAYELTTQQVDSIIRKSEEGGEA